jgi:hypothetical protein
MVAEDLAPKFAHLFTTKDDYNKCIEYFFNHNDFFNLKIDLSDLTESIIAEYKERLNK